MLRSACLANALLALATTSALACGRPPDPDPDVAREATCPADALAGDWIGDDGTRLRMLPPDAGNVHWRAVYLQDGKEGGPVYSDIRQGRGCRYMARRHALIDNRLHPAPPHSVMLTLDPARGRLVDDYRYSLKLRWRRSKAK